MLKQSKEASRHVDAVLSALDILDCFQDTASLSIKEIIERTGLTRSRVMRLVGTLEARGYVVENPDTKTIHPGTKLPILAKSFEQNNHVELLIRPILKQLAEETGESATFYVREGIERIALAREEGSHSIRYIVREGQRHLLHHGGAASKVLLAFGPKEWPQEVLADKKMNQEKFIEAIKEAQDNGYGISMAENTPGAHSISAPVYGHNGELKGALTISGPSIRMGKNQIKNLLGVVVDTAKFLSNRLGNSSQTKNRISA